jgi:DNA-binding PadR family transcriptional regulator
MDQLTTTSYAILSLLGVQSWTTYQLAQQMDRSLDHMWPRAASVVYEEPKRLVRLGLARAETVHRGRRASTVYSITDEGRAALTAWLDQPGRGPTIEFEALLKVAFADLGSVEGLRTNLEAIRQWAADDLEDHARRSADYAETGGPFPHRLPVIALVMRYYAEQAAAVERWATWALAETREWDGFS